MATNANPLGWQPSAEWRRLQLVTIGSTAAGVIANESPYESPRELYGRMIAARDNRLIDIPVNDDMRRGILTEPLHRMLLADELQREIHPHDQDQFLTNERYPWAHALPDGWLIHSETEMLTYQIPVQLKCPRPRSWHEIKLKGIHGHWLLGSQHTLAVTDAPFEQFSVLNPETFRVLTFPVYRDEILIGALMERERRFYDAYLIRAEPPEQTEKLELPAVKGQMMMLDTPEALDCAGAYRDALRLETEAKELRDLAEERIKKMMGEYRVIELPGLRCYKQDFPGRETLDKKKLQADGIDLTKYTKIGKPYSVFRPYLLGK
jgi:hypothetical protein